MLQDTGGEYGRPEQGKEKPFSEKWKERRKKYKQNRYALTTYACKTQGAYDIQNLLCRGTGLCLFGRRIYTLEESAIHGLGSKTAI